jgi:uridylate kinase
VTAQARYKRIVFKVSGESLSAPSAQLDLVRVREVAQSIGELREMGVAITVVVGGGNIIRGSQADDLKLDRVTADEIGMTATALNAQFLAGFLHSNGVPCQIFSRGTASGVGVPYDSVRMRELLAAGQVAIVAGGSGRPGHSTDLPAVQAAIDTCAEAIIMAKHGTEGVCEADPKYMPDARVLPELTASDALRWNLAVMDTDALELARDHGKCIHVVGGSNPHNVRYALEGQHIGSVVYPSEIPAQTADQPRLVRSGSSARPARRKSPPPCAR